VVVASVSVYVGEARHVQLTSYRDRHYGAVSGYPAAASGASENTPAPRAAASSVNWRSLPRADCSF
jgi:hypothetical protein